MSSYQFPDKMNTDVHPFLMFSSFKWEVRGKKTQNIEVTRTSVDDIILPLPEGGIVNQIVNNWESLGGLGAKTLGENIRTRWGSLLKERAKGMGGNFFSQRIGETVNDFASLAYNNVDAREFSFNWNLVPESPDDSEIIKNIVKSFKRNSLPSYEDIKILYPNFWEVILVIPQIDDIINFKDCVCTSMTDSYFTEDTNVMTDGNVMKTDLEVNFMELDKISKDEYKE